MELLTKDKNWVVAAICEFAVNNSFDVNDLLIKRESNDIVDIFTPKNLSRKGELFSYIYNHAQLSGKAYYDASLLPYSKVADIVYLYPIESLSIGSLTALISDVLTQEQIDSIINLGLFSIPMPGINPEQSQVDTLRRSLKDQYDISFNNNCLKIEACGYLQIKEIERMFNDLLTYYTMHKNRELDVYRNSEEKEQFNVPLYFVTFKDEKGEEKTNYYINTTADIQYSIAYRKEYTQEDYDTIKKRLVDGDAFTKHTKNIMRAYPGFIPSSGIRVLV